MTGAARLREALERIAAEDVPSNTGDFADDVVAFAREALAAVPEAPEPESKDSPSLSQSDELGA